MWSGDGQQLFFISTGNELMKVAVSSLADGLDFGRPEPALRDARVAIASGPGRYDVSRDGNRIALFTTDLHPTPFTVLVNWDRSLKQ